MLSRSASSLPAAAAARVLGLAAALLLAGAAPAGAATAPGAATHAPAKPRATGGAKGGKTKIKTKTKRVGTPVTVKAVAGASRPHRISEKAPRITAFPHESAAVDKAFAEHRREQIADAEKAARAGKQDDRWRTVLFYIRDLDSRTDPEACFWRVIAYYRLGELSRARSIRHGCEIPARDSATLDDEDAGAARLQPPAALPELKLAGELDDEGRPTGGEPVANSEPYTGQPPTRFK